MTDNLTYLPGVRRESVCAPDAAKKPEDILCIIIRNEMLADLGTRPGDKAIISLTEEPRHAEPGAIRSDGVEHVGYLYFCGAGGVFVAGHQWSRFLRYFPKDSYEILGRLDRVCGSCEGLGCRVLPKREAEAAAPLYVAAQ